MIIKKKIIDMLTASGISYQERQHSPTYTSEQSAHVRGESLSSGAKAIVYKVQDQFSLFVMAATEKIDTKKVKTYFKSLGLRAKKTRFATEIELFDLTGLVPGSVPPFGRPILPFNLYVDPSLLDNEMISFNAGSLTYSITMTLKDYIKVSEAVVFEFTVSKI